MSKEFLEKLRNYLNERFGCGTEYKQFEMETQPINRKWEIYNQGLVSCRFIYEYEDGRVQVESLCFDSPGDEVDEVLVRLHQRELKVKEKSKIFAKIDEIRKEILEDLKNRRNIERHVKKPYGHVFTRLLWADKIADEASRKFGVEVKVLIDDTSHHWRTYFISTFDSKNMDEDGKFEEIKKRVEAVSAARKLYDKSFKKEYKEFHRELLEKLKTSQR
jgi:hypothetical protein